MDKKAANGGKEKGPLEACWDEWSRCTGWSSAGTGVLWKSCDDQCKKLGKSGGECVLTPSTCPFTRTDKAYQCQCKK
uniref:Neuromacin-like protein n=1 Tax=Aplysia californica TaxID=6500 RepID=NEURM_APLCA|nr:neuromacin-like protein [Aplysia californica]A5GZY1.1 RecName: Full=Neuromacin-like protein; Flags: Precursor [Aplysia californica]ABF21076.1 theromacin [Aplysia californica]